MDMELRGVWVELPESFVESDVEKDGEFLIEDDPRDVRVASPLVERLPAGVPLKMEGVGPTDMV